MLATFRPILSSLWPFVNYLIKLVMSCKNASFHTWRTTVRVEWNPVLMRYSMHKICVGHLPFYSKSSSHLDAQTVCHHHIISSSYDVGLPLQMSNCFGSVGTSLDGIDMWEWQHYFYSAFVLTKMIIKEEVGNSDQLENDLWKWLDSKQN